ncbi:hypothetical protein Hanom_Chr04g00366541 [Helianthus anomalus]
MRADPPGLAPSVRLACANARTRAPATSPSKVNLPPGPWSPCASHSILIVAKCKVRNQSATLRPSPTSRARVRFWVLRTLREYTSVCFHKTIRTECFHLNTPLNFNSPMWDNVSLSQFFSILCLKHQTLSIDIFLILAPFWTWFSSLRRSSNIEHKPRINI